MKYFLHKYGTRPNEIRRAKRELYGRLSLVALVLIFFLMILVITRFQPRLGEAESPALNKPEIVNESERTEFLAAKRQEVDRIHNDFVALIDDPGSALENLELIERAIALQNEIIRSRSGTIASREDTQKLEQLIKVKDSVMGDYLIAQSLREENQAQEAWRNGDAEDAVKRMQRAILVQEKINEQYPRSPHRNSTRAHRLSGKLLIWQTQPIAEEADELKRNALDLVDQHKFVEARKTIRQAMKLQEQLMRDYRDSTYASLIRMRGFEMALLEIDAAEDNHNVELFIGLVRTRLDSGDHATALAKAEEALLLQEALMQRGGMDTPANLDKLELIKGLRDTAASTPVFEEAKAARSKTKTALLGRDMEAFQERLSTWYRTTRALQRRFPKSSLLREANFSEVDLLYELRREVPVIMELVYGNLVKLPTQSTVYMSATEVSQALYESVTGANPSSTKDPLLPAESVTWEEARQFTERLSVVLCRPVSLPTKDHFMAAVVDPGLSALAEQAWSAENSNRQAQPCGKRAANSAGFHDLLGNVSEWLASQPAGNPDSVLAIGGSARDSRARLTDIPEDWRSPMERNRYIGFRFVVDQGQVLE